MVVGSINPEAHKSMWYTAYSMILRKISLIYVTGNLSNTILLNYIWFSFLRACVSDDWASVMILTELMFLPLWFLFGEQFRIYQPCVCAPLSVRACSVLRSEDGIRFQGLFVNKTAAHDTQEKKKDKQVKADEPASFLRVLTSQANLSTNLFILLSILIVHDLSI